MTTKHWYVAENDGIECTIRDRDDTEADDGDGVVCRNATPDDADFIVTACNSHNGLLAACLALDQWSREGAGSNLDALRWDENIQAAVTLARAALAQGRLPASAVSTDGE